MSTTADKVSAAANITFELQSLIDSHATPFVVVDRNYRILAVNKAYAEVYGVTSGHTVGQTCHKISHNNDMPCNLYGEDCPHEHLFRTGEQHTCIHTHHNDQDLVHQVRVTAVPLYSASGELFMGELIQPLTTGNCNCETGKRMVGTSQAFTVCLDQLKLVAAANAPVLIQGETGTGKELAASYIHDQSMRSNKPYLTVDCTALTDTLFEAEVFGHAKGAYTGSVGEKSGLFDQADGGTLFLDEIGELPLTQQAKLLRVLETGKYRRVGGRATREVNVRIICATNRHLWEAVTAGRFREDLYYRIACLSVRLPSLRERIEDIAALADCLLEAINLTMQRQFRLARDGVDCLKTYHYPGNVRELRNILSIAAIHSVDDEINASVVEGVIEQLSSQKKSGPELLDEHVDQGAAGKPATGAAPVAKTSASGVKSLKDIETRYIRELLDRHNGNRRKVSAELGISQRTLYRKLKKYGLS